MNKYLMDLIKNKIIILIIINLLTIFLYFSTGLAQQRYLIWPIPTSQAISQNYGDYQYDQFHSAVDIYAPEGNEVFAVHKK